MIQEADGEVLIYDLSKNKAFCLNETSALVWQMCDGNKSVNEISEGLAKKLNAPANEDLVWLAIDQLKKEKLIINSEELQSSLEGLNRREVIKRIGLGTMVALPVVSGLIAPKAINAASAGIPSGTATAAGDICGGQAANLSARDAACDAQTGSNCSSGNAVRAPQSCTFDGTTSTFGCLCS